MRSQDFKLNELEKRTSLLYKKYKALSNPYVDINAGVKYEDISSFAFSSQNVVIDMGMKNDNSVDSDPIYFVCNANTATSINLGVSFVSTSNELTDIKVKVKLNGVDVHNETILCNNTYENTNYQISHLFISSQRDNKIEIFVYCENPLIFTTHQIKSVNTTIAGTNIIILNRDNKFKIFTINAGYFITKNFEGVSRNLTISRNATININGTYNLINLNLIDGEDEPLDSSYTYNYTVMPLVVYSYTNRNYYTSRYKNLYCFSYKKNNKVYVSSQYDDATTNYRIIVADNTTTYSLTNPCCDDISRFNAGVTVNISGVDKPALSSVADLPNVGIEILYNSRRIEGDYIYTIPCFCKQWESLFILPKYVIAQNKIGENFFFNARNSTCKLNLGFGTQINACVQPDGSINVYMRKGNNVIKKKLVQNATTSQFEIDTTTEEIFENTWEIIEGYSSDYFKNISGTWTYVAETT